MAGRTYFSPWTGKRVPGVTTVLNEWAKQGLPGWAAKLAVETGDPLAYKHVSEEKALEGHRVHEAIRTGVWPLDLLNYQEQYSLAWQSRPFEILSQEQPVYSDFGYGGTYDLIVQFFDEDEPTMLDVKTSEKGLYEDTLRLQVAAYRLATTAPPTDGAAALWLRPDRWEIRDVDADQEEFDLFLGLLDLYQWKRG